MSQAGFGSWSQAEVRVNTLMRYLRQISAWMLNLRALLPPAFAASAWSCFLVRRHELGADSLHTSYSNLRLIGDQQMDQSMPRSAAAGEFCRSPSGCNALPFAKAMLGIRAVTARHDQA